MKKAALFLLLPAVLLLGGCAHTVLPQVTPLQFDANSMDLLGPVMGETSKSSFLWGMFEAPAVGDGFYTQAAIQDALNKVHGDALLNPTVDQDVQDYFGLYYVVTLRVSGLAVRFKAKHRPGVPIVVDDTYLPPQPQAVSGTAGAPVGRANTGPARARALTPTPAPTPIPTQGRH